jgi:dTDP-4-dehydrorhamnose reductase
MTRILLIGSNGQVGSELELLLPDSKTLSRPAIDLAQPETLRDPIRQYRPDVIINATAYTAVDRAESEPDLAQAVNAIAPTIMAEEAQKLGAAVVHISTDYVFDGKKNTPYLETDLTHPLGVYGQTKLTGEIGVCQTCDRHVVLRTAWVYGVYGKGNFVKTMLRLGAERPQLKVVMDQVGSPTWARQIAEAIVQLLPHLEQKQFPSGIYHFTNSGVTSWYDCAIAIFEEARQLGWDLQVQEVLPITTAEYPTPAERPAYSVLACQKISSMLGVQPSHWREELRRMLAQLRQTLP